MVFWGCFGPPWNSLVATGHVRRVRWLKKELQDEKTYKVAPIILRWKGRG